MLTSLTNGRTTPPPPQSKPRNDSIDEQKDVVVASSLNDSNGQRETNASSSADAAAATAGGYSLFGAALSYLATPVTAVISYMSSSSESSKNSVKETPPPKIKAEDFNQRIKDARSAKELEALIADATKEGLYEPLITAAFKFILNDRIKQLTPQNLAKEQNNLGKFVQKLSGQAKITDANIENSEACRNMQILWQDKDFLRRTVVNTLALLCVKMEGRVVFDPDTQKLDQDIFFGWCKKMGLTSETLKLIKASPQYFNDIHFIEDEVYLGNSNTKYPEGIKDLIPQKIAKEESVFV